jgi:hypothetical protein
MKHAEKMSLKIEKIKEDKEFYRGQFYGIRFGIIISILTGIVFAFAFPYIDEIYQVNKPLHLALFAVSMAIVALALWFANKGIKFTERS